MTLAGRDESQLTAGHQSPSLLNKFHSFQRTLTGASETQNPFFTHSICRVTQELHASPIAFSCGPMMIGDIFKLRNVNAMLKSVAYQSKLPFTMRFRPLPNIDRHPELENSVWHMAAD